MTPVAQVMSYLVLFLSTSSIVGCGSTQGASDHQSVNASDELSGPYYFWTDGKPKAETFDYDQIPQATLVIEPSNRWRLWLMMREDIVIAGTWKREANTLTLFNDEDHSRVTFTQGDNRLTPLEGSLSIFLAMRKGDSFWKMSPKWEASAESVGARDGARHVASRIALGAIIYAGDNDETLPTTQAEFEKAVEPYVADKRMFAGYKYTFKGGKLPAESKRGTVELGIYYGPTGKVIVYLDGETKWVPKT